MTMLQLTREELDKHNVFSPQLNTHLTEVVNAIPFTTVSSNMKAIIAATQITAFASQFRRNILLWDGTEVPINAISFVITGSGNGKDSSVNAARKCFSEGYQRILKAREQAEIQRAIKTAIANDEDPSQANSEEIYSKYLRPLPPIDIMPTTGPGLIQHINDISDLDTTAGLLYAGEFSDELAYNPDIMENIKILSEIYDLGVKATKYTKSIEHRSKAINGQAVSALFVGSPGHILYDEATKKKFHIAFMSKLARRSWFCYSPERLTEPDFMDQPNPIQAMLDYRTNMDTVSLAAREKMSQHVLNITDFGLSTVCKPIGISEEVRRMFEVYKRYNTDLADSLANQDSTSALIRRHLQWKALKLAGAFAIFDCSNEIQQTHYIDAIRFAEIFEFDMERFEADLNKAPHERFSDYIRTLVQYDGKAVVSVHDLKKNNFISTVSQSKLQELVHLCSGYDHSGIYSITNEGGSIQYEPIIKTEVLNISFKPINTYELNLAIASGDSVRIRSAKDAIGRTTANGLQVSETTFADLANLLEGDFAYSPFRFRDGIRTKENLINTTKWLVLDVDKSAISAAETHFLLSDINHHIALSSDPDNDYKFRVLIELDSNVDLSPVAWKHFYQAIAEDLAIRVDPVPQSQIFYSYAGRTVYSNLDAKPIEARPYIVLAKEQELAREHKTTVVSSAVKQALLADPLTTFSFSFDARMGEGSRSMIRAAYYAKDLGADYTYCESLIHDINEYWEFPMPTDRITAILEQVKRLF